MKTYIVEFTPNDTAPAGELGKPDFFGFKATADSAAAAISVARARFDDTFPHLAAHYVATNVEIV